MVVGASDSEPQLARGPNRSFHKRTFIAVTYVRLWTVQNQTMVNALAPQSIGGYLENTQRLLSLCRRGRAQHAHTRVPAPCTDSMPQRRRQGPSVHPPGRRAMVACVLLPEVRSSARPVAQPVRAKHGRNGRGRRRGGACVHVRAVRARRWLTCCLRRGCTRRW